MVRISPDDDALDRNKEASSKDQFDLINSVEYIMDSKAYQYAISNGLLEEGILPIQNGGFSNEAGFEGYVCSLQKSLAKIMLVDIPVKQKDFCLLEDLVSRLQMHPSITSDPEGDMQLASKLCNKSLNARYEAFTEVYRLLNDVYQLDRLISMLHGFATAVVDNEYKFKIHKG